MVGGSPTLFDDNACAAVHYFTGGVPRLINLLCDQALLYAYAEDQSSITIETILEAVFDRNRGGLSAFRDLVTCRPPVGLLDELRFLLLDIRANGGQGAT